MAQIKYQLSSNGEQAVKEILGVDELNIEEGARGNKAIIPFEYEVSEDKALIAIKFNGKVSGTVKIETVNPEDILGKKAKGQFSMLKIKKYTFELSDGNSFESESPYDLSVSALALRLFTKAVAPIKAKYAPTRTSMASVNKAKLKEEIAAYKAMKSGKAVEAEVSENAEVSEDAEY